MNEKKEAVIQFGFEKVLGLAERTEVVYELSPKLAFFKMILILAPEVIICSRIIETPTVISSTPLHLSWRLHWNFA